MGEGSHIRDLIKKWDANGIKKNGKKRTENTTDDKVKSQMLVPIQS